MGGWRDQYDRMHRSYMRVASPQPNTSSTAYDDDLYHFFQDCWHLKDWVKNDVTLGSTLGPQVEDRVKKYESLLIAADLANGSKHLRLDTPRLGAAVTSVNVNVQIGAPIRTETEHIVTLQNGTQRLAQDVAHQALVAWDEILKDEIHKG